MKNNNFKPWIKEERRLQAIEHTEKMEKEFPDNILYSVNNSKVYYGPLENEHKPKIFVDDLTTDKAVIKYSDDNFCVLNFASFNYPGGGFIIGAIAQEEALCHASNLYNVIGRDNFAEYYENNRKESGANKKFSNGTLYRDFAIFSPDIIFIDSETNNTYKADVITCPAPNLSNFTGSESLARETMDKRIKFILDIATKHNVKNLILGAFGCGVFKNDPEFVAYTFKKYIEDYNYNFDKIVFAIPAGPNYDIFKKVFNDDKEETKE